MLFCFGDLMTQISIKPALEQDSQLILTILQQSFAQYRDNLVPPSSIFNETIQSLEHKLTQGGGFIAYADYIAAGCVLFEVRESYIYLGRLGVLNSYRKHGIATQLITAVEAVAEKYAHQEIRLAVRINLTQNRTFFESIGYKTLSYHKHDGFEEPTYVEMGKTLESD